jgi:hypothetical protein
VLDQVLRRSPTSLMDKVFYAVATIVLAEDRLGNFDSSRTHGPY